jgi:hypothetical protein
MILSITSNTHLFCEPPDLYLIIRMFPVTITGTDNYNNAQQGKQLFDPVPLYRIVCREFCKEGNLLY